MVFWLLPGQLWLTKNLKTEINNSISPLTRFLLLAGVVYAGWQLLYDLVLLPDGRLDTFLSLSGVRLASGLLTLLGWDVEISGRVITCLGHRGVEINNGCNGLHLLGLYAGLIIAYPGPWKQRTLFLTGGLILLYLANAVRIGFFAVFNANLPEYWSVAHDYSSYVFFYPIVLSLWYLWTVYNRQEQIIAAS